MKELSNEELMNLMESKYIDFENIGSNPAANGVKIIQNEILRRELINLNDTNKNLISSQNKNRKQTKIFSWISFLLSILMISLAGTTIYYAYEDSKFDRGWQSKQETILKNIDNSIQSIPFKIEADTCIKE